MQRRRGGPGTGTRVAQLVGQLGETLQGDRPHNVRSAVEVAVEDGLAVLDALGQASHRHGVPAPGFGQLTGGRHDELLAAGTFAVSALG